MLILKRIHVLILLMTVSYFLVSLTTHATIITEETQHIEGATYTKIQQSIPGGLLQTIHVLEADFRAAPYKVLVGDNYSKYAYGVATTLTHAVNTQSRFGDYIVIGGVNADFFEGAGVPQEAYIRDGHILSSGIGYPARAVIGFKDDGTMVHGLPQFDGYELIVLDQDGKERITFPIKNINTTYQANPHDVYVYFDTYRQTLPSGVQKYIATVIETKGALPKIYGHGTITEVQKTQAHTIQTDQLVVVSENIYLTTLIQPTDRIIVQRRMVGAFEGVKWAIGAYGKLVDEGEMISNIVGIDPTSRHPRTAVGIKADGSTFFLAVDGRQTGYSNGATLYQLAQMMIDRGAVVAYNLDGGGSTTMVLRNNQDGFFVANQPSDGSPRPVTNSLILALQVNFPDKSPHPIPDLSIELDAPTNVFVDRGVLKWSSVPNRTRYEIEIDGTTYQTSLTQFDIKELTGTPSTYEIYVRAIGDGVFFKTSQNSEKLLYHYQGPTVLPTPSQITFRQGILEWDIDQPHNNYQVKFNDRTYTISLNRFNFNTQNLAPGSYEMEIIALGDGYNHLDSEPFYFTYRRYSAVEVEVQSTLKLVLELLYLRSKD